MTTPTTTLAKQRIEMGTQPQGNTLLTCLMGDYRRLPTLLMEMVDMWQMLLTQGRLSIHQNLQGGMARTNYKLKFKIIYVTFIDQKKKFEK